MSHRWVSLTTIQVIEISLNITNSAGHKLSIETRAHCEKVYTRFAALYERLRSALQNPFDLTQRQCLRDTLKSTLLEITALHPLDPEKLRAMKESLRARAESYFTCLTHKGIPPDNNKAERALRHLVLKRKTSFGSKTQRGAQVTEVLASVLLSLWWGHPDTFFQEYRTLRGV